MDAGIYVGSLLRRVLEQIQELVAPDDTLGLF